MIYTLLKNGVAVASANEWRPQLFSQLTETSFPKEVPDGWYWKEGEFEIVSTPSVVPVYSQEDALRDWRLASEVSALKAQQALHLSGKLQQVQDMMNKPETDPMIVLAWNKAQTFKRMSPTVLGMAVALGLSEADLDALFTLAESLPDA